MMRDTDKRITCGAFLTDQFFHTSKKPYDRMQLCFLQRMRHITPHPPCHSRQCQDNNQKDFHKRIKLVNGMLQHNYLYEPKASEIYPRFWKQKY